jgi:hypothetical protein
MEIVELSTRRVEGGREITVTGYLAGREELTGPDLVELERLIRELGGHVGREDKGETPTENLRGSRRRGAAEAEQAGEPEAPAGTSGRRRRGAEPAEAEPASPATGRSRARRGAESPAAEPSAASTDGASGTSRRRREPAPAEEAPAEGRRRRPAPTEEAKVLTEADLVKATTDAHSKLHKAVGKKGEDLIADLIYQFDDKGGNPCEKVASIVEADRQKYLDDLDKLVADNA